MLVSLGMCNQLRVIVAVLRIESRISDRGSFTQRCYSVPAIALGNICGSSTVFHLTVAALTI